MIRGEVIVQDQEEEMKNETPQYGSADPAIFTDTERRNLGASQPASGNLGLRFVAWHQGGAVTMRIGKRHLAHEADLLIRNRVTLCGRTWKASAEVVPSAGWTTGDCARCMRLSGQNKGN